MFGRKQQKPAIRINIEQPNYQGHVPTFTEYIDIPTPEPGPEIWRREYTQSLLSPPNFAQIQHYDLFPSQEQILLTWEQSYPTETAPTDYGNLLRPSYLTGDLVETPDFILPPLDAAFYGDDVA